MSDLIVIGISGKAGSGKDTAARALEFHRGCHRIALADPIKTGLDDLAGPTRDLYKQLADDGKTPGWAWQVLGTEAREDVPGANLLWVQLALAKIAYLAFHHPKPVRRFVIPDIRRDYEAAELRRVIEGAWGYHYATLGLERPDARIAGGRDAGHKSETLIGDVKVDRVYVNRSTIADLNDQTTVFFDRTSFGHYETPAPPIAVLCAEGETD